MTRGGGMSAMQRALWLLSIPVTAQYTMKMEENLNVYYETSEQHFGNKYASKTRVTRDLADSIKVEDYISKSVFLSEDTVLRNITTGEEADDQVNVDELFTIGNKIIADLENESIFECKMKRNDAVSK